MNKMFSVMNFINTGLLQNGGAELSASMRNPDNAGWKNNSRTRIETVCGAVKAKRNTMSEFAPLDMGQRAYRATQSPGGR